MEGLNPTDDPDRPYWGFSTDFQPHDGGPFEVVYADVPPFLLPSTRLGEKALIRSVVSMIVQQLDDTFRRWYGRDPAGMCRDGVVRGAVDLSRIFVVGHGDAATLALDLLNRDPGGDFEFAGAALVVGTGGGTLGGRVIADPERLVVGDPFNADYPVGIAHLPDPSSPAKAILVICDTSQPHYGVSTDTMAGQVVYPNGPPESATSRNFLAGADLDTGAVGELVRLEYTVFATLNEWTSALQLGTAAFASMAAQTAPTPFLPGVEYWSIDSGSGSGFGKMQILGISGLGDAWPHVAELGQEGLLAIFQFFDSFDP